PTDFVLVCEELDRSGTLEQIGGYQFLSHILNAVPTSINVEHYAHIVERTALMRRLISAAGRIASIGYEDSADAEDSLGRAQAELAAVAGARRRATDPVKLALLLSEQLEQIEPQRDPDSGELIEKRARIASGYLDLDRLTGGFGRSDLVILAARPSLGKTSLALNIARNVGVTWDAPTLI